MLVFLSVNGIFAAHAADYTPTGVEATVYADGVVGITYRLDVDPTLARIKVPLFGAQFTDLLIVNQDGLPLNSVLFGSTATVDTLGAGEVTVTYATQDLTTKLGTLWTFNITSPVNMAVLLPSGSTIVDLSEVPLSVGTFSGGPAITMAAGNTSISYVLTTVGAKDHAQSVIQDAQATIASVKAKEISVSVADSLMAQAQASFSAGDYLKAEQYAAQAQASALQAQDAANQPTLQGGMFLYVVLALVCIWALSTALLVKRRLKASIKQLDVPTANKDEGPVNLEVILSKNDLRIDDKEVIKFIAQNGGEAFANEIRDRFDIPRTSAWRMIRRLIGMGIVEERKVGGQSLICFVKKYRGSQKR